MFIPHSPGHGREHIEVELEVAHLGALVKGHSVPRAPPERHQQRLGLGQRTFALGARFAGGALLLILAISLRAHAVQELVDVLDRERLDAIEHHKLVWHEVGEGLALVLLCANWNEAPW